ncbi:uncharacterized protein EI90DRAFT_3284496 [Cantharellus anzutake]|uniref:uncharacterized protein n=1 Tax=Cantharellus anzutake TaxID=1750568 RepID=UPI0019036ACF|nr:uncharacterized protein EI90DRAFT_3284496 [Cantharellus anzutake]KAF8343976.1 hypothetical protein EI90DRAFT_3284496 [Cantharellus anzutake]
MIVQIPSMVDKLQVAQGRQVSGGRGHEVKIDMKKQLKLKRSSQMHLDIRSIRHPGDLERVINSGPLLKRNVISRRTRYMLGFVKGMPAPIAQGKEASDLSMLGIQRKGRFNKVKMSSSWLRWAVYQYRRERPPGTHIRRRAATRGLVIDRLKVKVTTEETRNSDIKAKENLQDTKEFYASNSAADLAFSGDKLASEFSISLEEILRSRGHEGYAWSQTKQEGRVLRLDITWTSKHKESVHIGPSSTTSAHHPVRQKTKTKRPVRTPHQTKGRYQDKTS